jgi:hypothetical protein
MDRKDLDRAIQDAGSQLSKRVEKSSPISSDDLRSRVAIFSRLFTLFPLASTQDTEGAILVFVEETMEIPLDLLEQGLRALTREPTRRFAPSLGEIRYAAQPPKPEPTSLVDILSNGPDRDRYLAWREALEANRLKLFGRGPT